jgi:hypothetical protein
MNKIYKRLIILTLAIPTVLLQLTAQKRYNDYRSMSGEIELLRGKYPSLCSVHSLVKTAGGREIRVISIGSGERDSKPGIAVFGGVDGGYVLGRELAMGFATSILKESSSAEIKALLDKVTFYVFPDVSPDASEQFFSELKYERTGNARSADEDRDFLSDEDGFEDLNKDGLITLVRVNDPSGKFIKSEKDNRIMVEADISKGQSGNYLVFSEGIDNDKDNKLNEDGPGGVNFNSNFTFNYESFGYQAGLYPVSEPETKAVADFLYDRFNIYSLFIFGPQDNLGQPQKNDGTPGSDKVLTTIMKEDEAINKLVSDKYHEITSVKGAPVAVHSRGDFMEWAYFHYGRYSFSTPAWWFPSEKDQDQSIAFLKYADTNIINNVFVPWTEISHPDFPGKKVEAGGIKPFAMRNPPADSLENLIRKNYRFIISIAGMHPELEFLDLKTENAGEGIWRVTLKLHNKGIFATCARIGDENMWTRIMRITVEPVKGQSIISGLKVQRVDRLEGNQSAEFSWLVSGKGSLKITAGSVNTGSVSATAVLK